MVRKIIKNFEVEYLQILDENGNCDENLKPQLTDSEIKKLYETMILTRKLDAKALSMQRQGRLGTYASTLGQEAAHIGPAYATQNSDWIFPSFREHGAYIIKGYPLHMILQSWAGDERGNQTPQGINLFTVSIPVGTHLPHAVGFAWAAKMKKEKTVTMAFFGDGATSEGDFHEALNFAGVFQTPTVFVCQNNQWAISVPREKQTRAETLAQKAIAYGFKGLQVDGNDILATYQAAKEAVENARNGKGPTFIECFTYRISDHTTSDSAIKYRKQEEVEAWKKKDPIERLRKYMQKKGIWMESYEKQVVQGAELKVEQAVEKLESIQPQKPEEIFKYTLAKPTTELLEGIKEVGQ